MADREPSSLITAICAFEEYQRRTRDHSLHNLQPCPVHEADFGKFTPENTMHDLYKFFHHLDDATAG